MNKNISDKEVIAYLVSIIEVLSQGLESKANLNSYVCANGPTFRTLIERAHIAAQTNKVEF